MEGGRVVVRPLSIYAPMNASPPPPDAAAASADLAQLHALMRARDFAAALTAGEAVLAASPTHRDARLLVAIAQRYLGRTADALRTLATLQQQYPRFSRLYEERGRCYVELRQAPEAIQAFLTAVNLNHALPGSWSMLEGLYRMTGEAQNEAMAGSHVATLKKIPADIVAATAFFMDGDLDASEALVRAWLLKNGDHIEGMRLLARIGIARDLRRSRAAAGSGAGACARLPCRAPGVRERSDRAASSRGSAPPPHDAPRG